MARLLLLLMAAGPERAALDSVLLSPDEAGPECQLQSTEPLADEGASLVPRADAQLRQVFDCGGDLAVVDLFDEGSNIERGVRDLERSRWGGPRPPARMHDALLRKGAILADVFASRAATVLLQAKLQAIGFQSLANAKPVDFAALEAKERPAKRRASTANAADPGAAIDWLAYDDGLREAAVSHKPICLVFTTTWCPHCHNYEKVLHDSRVAAKSKAFVMVKVDEDHAGDLGNKYAPDGHYVPRTLFLTPEGDLVAELAAQRARDRYVYSDTDPSSLLGGMDRALAHFRR